MDKETLLRAINSIKEKIQTLCSMLNYSDMYLTEDDWQEEIIVAISSKGVTEAYTIKVLKIVNDNVFFVDKNNKEFKINVLSKSKSAFSTIDYILKLRIKSLKNGGSEPRKPEIR